jgi:hypothetical protein
MRPDWSQFVAAKRKMRRLHSTSLTIAYLAKVLQIA